MVDWVKVVFVVSFVGQAVTLWVLDILIEMDAHTIFGSYLILSLQPFIPSFTTLIMCFAFTDCHELNKISSDSIHRAVMGGNLS